VTAFENKLNPPRFERQGAGVLTYHAISSQVSGSVYTVTVSQFEEHLKLIAEFNRSAVCPTKRIQLTFDDGHVSNYELAIPLLEQYSIKSTFFVVAGFIESRAEYMTWGQLREMSALGHDIQSHSWSHPMLPRCSDAHLHEELERSRKTIEQRIGSQVSALGLPGGRWNPRVLIAAASLGYQEVYNSNPLIGSTGKEGVQLIGRLTIKNSMRPKQVQDLIGGRGIYTGVFRLQYRAKECFRKTIGDTLYGQVWSLLAKRNSSQALGTVEKSPVKHLGR